MSGTSYKNGTARARLPVSNLDPSITWHKRGDGSKNALDFVNTAFQLYYDSITEIKKCSNAKHKQKMLSQLKDAATDGHDDLYDVFDYLYNNTVWKDNDSKLYGGNKRNVYYGKARAPTGIVNFMDSVNQKMVKLGKSAGSYTTSTADLVSHGENKEWDRVGTIIGNIKSFSEKAHPFFWNAPKIQSHVGRVVGYTDVMGKIHSGLDTYQKAKNAGFPNGTAGAIAALRVSMEWVPVLGDLYGKAVELLPTLAASFGQLVKTRHQKILNIARAT